MAKKDWMAKLTKLEGAVDKDVNVFQNVLRTPSPSMNFIFGGGHGLPYGYTMIMYGPPAGGKSILCNAIIGQLHRDDPEAIAVKFNTELRETGQTTAEQRKIWGIDDDRYIAYDVNHPEMIFDRIEKEIAAMCQEGAPIRLIVIDSINGIIGRRATNADTIMTQQIGDDAKTQQDGFKFILNMQRKYHIAVILTSHVRAEMDVGEQMRGNKLRMGAGLGVQHYGEYFVFVEPNRSKEGKTDLLGAKFEDEENTDLMDKAEVTGHKIRVTMKKSSMGPKLRTGELTLDYHRGVINIHEEAFLLGTNRNVIQRPNNLTYVLGEKKWSGKPAMLDALKEDPQLQEQIITEIKKRDKDGAYRQEDDANALNAIEEE